MGIEDLAPVGTFQKPYNIIILDGTWQQAKSIFYRNFFFRDVKQVSVYFSVIELLIRSTPFKNSPKNYCRQWYSGLDLDGICYSNFHCELYIIYISTYLHCFFFLVTCKDM